MIEYLSLDDVPPAIDDPRVGPIREIGWSNSAVHRPHVSVFGADAWHWLSDRPALRQTCAIHACVAVTATTIEIMVPSESMSISRSPPSTSRATRDGPMSAGPTTTSSMSSSPPIR